MEKFLFNEIEITQIFNDRDNLIRNYLRRFGTMVNLSQLNINQFEIEKVIVSFATRYNIEMRPIELTTYDNNLNKKETHHVDRARADYYNILSSGDIRFIGARHSKRISDPLKWDYTEDNKGFWISFDAQSETVDLNAESIKYVDSLYQAIMLGIERNLEYVNLDIDHYNLNLARRLVLQSGMWLLI